MQVPVIQWHRHRLQNPAFGEVSALMRKAVVVGENAANGTTTVGWWVMKGAGKQRDKRDDEEEIGNCDHLLDQRQRSASRAHAMLMLPVSWVQLPLSNSQD